MMAKKQCLLYWIDEVHSSLEHIHSPTKPGNNFIFDFDLMRGKQTDTEMRVQPQNVHSHFGPMFYE